jgi:hypothetical protein
VKVTGDDSMLNVIGMLGKRHGYECGAEPCNIGLVGGRILTLSELGPPVMATKARSRSAFALALPFPPVLDVVGNDCLS